MMEQLRAVSTRRLGRRLGAVDPATSAAATLIRLFLDP
jgi:mRNA-degrading endonuclease toxin of MazEF toxin-antitoxin module